MRIKLERIKIEYQDDRYFNLAFYIPGEPYPARIWLSWRQWDFVNSILTAQDEGFDRPLNIGDFALTDGVNRYIEFFSDAIRIKEYDKPYPLSIPFPFHRLANRIRQRATEIGPEEIEALRLRHWPRTRVVWQEVLDREVIKTCYRELWPHLKGLVQIAKNYSDGELCVVHMYRDGSAGQTMEKVRQGERPSFYWEIRRYRELPTMPESLRAANLNTYKHLNLYGRTYVADARLVYKTEYFTDYGQIMVGGLIWHPNHKDPTTGSYSVHT